MVEKPDNYKINKLCDNLAINYVEENSIFPRSIWANASSCKSYYKFL
jgi:hypothetical protein